MKEVIRVAGRKLTVGVVQMWPVFGEVTENLRIAERGVRELAARGSKVIVLPELFSTGYDLSSVQATFAEPEDGPTLTMMTNLADELDLVLVSAVLLSVDGAVVDRAVIVDSTGVLDAADKALLWGAEPMHFTRGSGRSAFAETRAGAIGVAICYEAGFPERIRALAQQGSDIIAVPAAFGLQRAHAWDLMTRSRALENGTFLLAGGLCGENKSGAQFVGTSRIVGPRGEVLAELGRSEPGVLSYAIDLGDAQKARSEIPYLRDLMQHASPRTRHENFVRGYRTIPG